MKLLDIICFICLFVYQRIIYPVFFNRAATPSTMTVNPNPSSKTSPVAVTNSTNQYSTATNNTTSTFSRFFSSAFSSAPASSQELLNSLVKWFYMNMDATNRINNTILNIFNFNFAGSGQRPMSVGPIIKLYICTKSIHELQPN